MSVYNKEISNLKHLKFLEMHSLLMLALYGFEKLLYNQEIFTRNEKMLWCNVQVKSDNILSLHLDYV